MDIGCAWKTWRTQVETRALVSIESDVPVRVIGLDLAGLLPRELSHDGLLETTKSRLGARMGRPVTLVEGCAGRGCVRWDGGTACLTQKARRDALGAGGWSVAFQFRTYDEGSATTLANTVRGSHPAAVSLDVALFDPQQRLVTSARVRLSRDESGTLARSFSSQLPGSLSLSRRANVVTRATGPNTPAELPRTIGPGAGPLLRQVFDDAAWLIARISQDTRTDEVLVLLRWAGEENDRAIAQALLGDVDGAIRRWHRLDTSSHRIAFNLGIANAVLGNDRESAHHLEAAEAQRSTGMSRQRLAAARERKAWRALPPQPAWCD